MEAFASQFKRKPVLKISKLNKPEYFSYIFCKTSLENIKRVIFSDMIYDFIILLMFWLYPAFASYKSLNATADNQVTWMKYWIVFGFFNAIFILTSGLENWLPFLQGIKFAIMCWIQPSLGGGCRLILDTWLGPLIRRNSAKIKAILDVVSNMSSIILRELIKMLYMMIVGAVAYCWQMTPGLQSAVNEVIADLRLARQAAATLNSSSASSSNSEGTSVASSPNRNRSTNLDLMTMQSKSQMTANDKQLAILLAESIHGKRMQFIQQLSSLEHLVPINCCGCHKMTPAATEAR